MQKLEVFVAEKLQKCLKEDYCFVADFDDMVPIARAMINEYQNRVGSVVKSQNKLSKALDCFFSFRKIKSIPNNYHSAELFRQFLDKNYWVFIFKKWW